MCIRDSPKIGLELHEYDRIMTKIIGLLTSTVIEIGKIHFEGNIIPHQWYQHIVLESGKPDLPAIIILAEIIYWYRPYQTLDKSGKPLLRKHFDGDMFQCTAAYFESKFGLTKDQVRKALKRLEDAGYILYLIHIFHPAQIARVASVTGIPTRA